MLRHRLLTGALLIASIVALTWLDERLTAPDGALPRGLLLGVLCIGVLVPLLAIETCALLRRAEYAVSEWLAVLGAMSITLAMWLGGELGLELIATVLTGVIVIAAIDSTRGRMTSGLIQRVSGTVFVVCFAGVALGFWLMLRETRSAWFVLWAIGTVKMADIGAYTVGCSIGRHRLIPWLSPKKTWEGLAGGIVFASAAGALAPLLTASAGPEATISIWSGIAWGACAAILGLVGDLFASAMKRDARVKDSGAILPGLGGIIDTLDSLIPVAPLALWWLA